MSTNSIRVWVLGAISSAASEIVELLSKDSRLTVAGRSFNFTDSVEKLSAAKPNVFVLVERGIVGAGEMLDFLHSEAASIAPSFAVCLIRQTASDIRAAGAADVMVLRHDSFFASGKENTKQEMYLHIQKVNMAYGARAALGAVTRMNAPTAGNSVAAVSAKPAAMPLSSISAIARGAQSAKVIAIGASTGGTEATAKLLKDLPGNLPGMVIVQHMPPGFTEMYAERLNRDTPHTVRECGELERIQPGLVLIAPGDRHMRVVRRDGQFFAEVTKGERVNGHCPSVDVLFDSVAAVCGKSALGVILTGMGGDGAKGLLKMRNAGAFTLGQDEASSVVYGMPKVAFDIGAVHLQTPLNEMAAALLKNL